MQRPLLSYLFCGKNATITTSRAWIFVGLGDSKVKQRAGLWKIIATAYTPLIDLTGVDSPVDSVLAIRKSRRFSVKRGVARLVCKWPAKHLLWGGFWAARGLCEKKHEFPGCVG